MRRHQDCVPGLNQEHSVTTDVSSLADILRGEDTNIAISNGDPQDKGNHIAASTKNAVNRAKKEEYMINRDLKLIDTFVKKVCSGLKKVGDTCKPLEEEAFRVLENLLGEWKI